MDGEADFPSVLTGTSYIDNNNLKCYMTYHSHQTIADKSINEDYITIYMVA